MTYTYRLLGEFLHYSLCYTDVYYHLDPLSNRLKSKKTCSEQPHAIAESSIGGRTNSNINNNDDSNNNKNNNNNNNSTNNKNIAITS